MIEIHIPGRGPLRLRRLILDLNGTLSCDGKIMEGVAERIRCLSDALEITLLSADTFGTLEAVAESLGVSFRRARNGEEKAAFLQEIGPENAVAVGNGANDGAMMERAALSIAVLGPEGLSPDILSRADVLVRDVGEGLGLLLHPERIKATLRL